jgi:hypothetical protein
VTHVRRRTPPARLVGGALALVAVAGMASAVFQRPHTVFAAATRAAGPGVPAARPTAPAARTTPAPATLSPPTLPVPSPVALQPVAQVAPLGTLRTPDLMLVLKAPLSGRQLTALHAVKGLQDLAVLDTGLVRVGGQPVHVVGVDPSQFRAFTPRETASSDPLWQAVARGELVSTYALSRGSKLPLGGTIPVAGPSTVPARLGAVAVFGVPGADLVVDRTLAASLGAVAGGGALLSAPGEDLQALQGDVRAAVGSAVAITVLRPAVIKPYRVTEATAPSPGKPRNYRDLYIASAHYCPGLSWKVLAAIGQVESDHGRNAGVSSAGALGPMQFLPSTWAFAGVDGDGDGKADILNPFDAVPAAALYLCRAGAGQGGQALYDAVFSYNHADSYVKLVLGLAARYS